MYFWTSLLLLGSGLVAGLVNSIAGGGAIVVYPLLLSLGISPIVANATMSVMIWPGALSSAYGYRRDLAAISKKFYLLLIPTSIGGLIGAFLLKRTPLRTFELIVPWLFICGVLLLALQPTIHKKLYSRTTTDSSKRGLAMLATVSILVLILAIYGGYFGIGFGIVMLALLGLTELTDLRQMNGLKNLAAIIVNIIGMIYFTMSGLVNWRLVPLVALGCIAGGYIGSIHSARLPAKVIRGIIIAIGIVISIILFIKL